MKGVNFHVWIWLIRKLMSSNWHQCIMQESDILTLQCHVNELSIPIQIRSVFSLGLLVPICVFGQHHCFWNLALRKNWHGLGAHLSARVRCLSISWEFVLGQKLLKLGRYCMSTPRNLYVFSWTCLARVSCRRWTCLAKVGRGRLGPGNRQRSPTTASDRQRRQPPPATASGRQRPPATASY